VSKAAVQQLDDIVDNPVPRFVRTGEPKYLSLKFFQLNSISVNFPVENFAFLGQLRDRYTESPWVDIKKSDPGIGALVDRLGCIHDSIFPKMELICQHQQKLSRCHLVATMFFVNVDAQIRHKLLVTETGEREKVAEHITYLRIRHTSACTGNQIFFLLKSPFFVK